MPTAKTLETELNSFSYNCGGYALGTYNWYIPFNNRDLVSDNAEEDWLARNNCESYWDLNEKDLESLKRIGDVLKKSKSVILIPHVNIDGDDLGSMTALSLGLNSLGYMVKY